MLWVGCLVPVVNLAWAPVFIIELAMAEDRYERLQRRILLWWVLWLASTAVSVFATATAFTTEPQGIADNTVSFTIAYLLAAASVFTLYRTIAAFESRPVERRLNRWLSVAGDESKPVAGDEPAPKREKVDLNKAPETEKQPEPAVAVESKGQEPAA